ncbi:unnamed protein product, partial [Rotaria sp. Silwood1]
VTSTQLLNWSASIDIAEKYEIKGADSTEIFYNCSSPWFGSKCQYRFENNVQATFHDIVRLQFFTRNTFGNAPITCLDWRMICDGKFDCINRMDEDNCQILETNECPSDTYRCHFGGQCIPLAFVRDGSNTADCLDGTDEMHLFEKRRYHFASSCFKIPTFACEERTGPYQRYFSCSDGQYHPSDKIDLMHLCANGRQFLEHLHHQLYSVPILMEISDEIFDSTLASNVMYLQKILNQSASIFSLMPCTAIDKKCLSEWIFKAKFYYMFWKFHFIYLPDRLVKDLIILNYPDFICFYIQDCSVMINCAVEIGLDDELICCPSSKLFDTSIINGDDLFYAIKNLFFRCTTTGVDQSCSHPSLFHCSLSSKCISKHRLLDGISDCYYGEDEADVHACHLNDSQRFICESESNKCLSLILVQNGNKDCKDGEDEMTENQRNMLKGIVPFSLICNHKND